MLRSMSAGQPVPHLLAAGHGDTPHGGDEGAYTAASPVSYAGTL